MASYIGSKLELDADDGLYTGILKAVDQNNGRLSLERVTAVSSGKKMNGVIHFFKSDINNIKILEDKKKRIVSEDNSLSSGVRLLGRKQTPVHLKRLRNIEYDKLTLAARSRLSSGEEEGDKTQDEDNDSGEDSQCQNCFDSDAGPCRHTSKKSQQATCDTISDEIKVQVTVIEKIDEEFVQAIDFLKMQSIVGLAMEGINLGRFGQLCFVQFAVKEHIIVFDFVALGKNGMKEGIADILKSENIQKVAHDCRHLSDMLYNQYDTNLVNVFDTQVAKIMVYRSENGGDVPKFAPGLQSTLFEHLGLSSDEVYVERMREQHLESDMSIWKKRPANKEVLLAAVRNVAYLRDLRRVLLARMLSDFTDGVDIYLGTVRDASDEQAKIAANHNNSTPEEFSSLQASARVSRARWRPGDYDQRGFRVNCTNTDDPMIKFSHDGVWHKNDGTAVRWPQADQRESRSRSRGRARSKPTAEYDPKDIVYADKISSGSLGKSDNRQNQSENLKDTNVLARMDEKPQLVNVDVELLDASVKDIGLDTPIIKPMRSPNHTRKKPIIDLDKTREISFIVAGQESIVGQFKLKDRASEKAFSTGSTGSACSEDDSAWELVSESEVIGDQFDQIPKARSNSGTELKHLQLPVKSQGTTDLPKSADSKVTLIPDTIRKKSIREVPGRTAYLPPSAAVGQGFETSVGCKKNSLVSCPPARGRGAALIQALTKPPSVGGSVPSHSKLTSSEEQLTDPANDNTNGSTSNCFSKSQPRESYSKPVLTKSMGRASALHRYAAYS